MKLTLLVDLTMGLPLVKCHKRMLMKKMRSVTDIGKEVLERGFLPFFSMLFPFFLIEKMAGNELCFFKEDASGNPSLRV